MSLLGGFKSAFVEGLQKANPKATREELEGLTAALEERIREEPPPKIALIGEAGVGKSSTINALFNAGVPVSHTAACTRTDIHLTIDFGPGPSGLPRCLQVTDMPGLGESISADRANLEVYHQVLPHVDVAVWVLDCQNRAIRSVQERLRDDLSKIPGAIEKLVVALNKVDLVDPGPTEWNTAFNVPSASQRHNIGGRLSDVRSKLSEVVPNWNGRTVAYSAAKRFRLSELFAEIFETVPAGRRWLFGDRMNLASYEELIDPKVLRVVKRMDRERGNG